MHSGLTIISAPDLANMHIITIVDTQNGSTIRENSESDCNQKWDDKNPSWLWINGLNFSWTSRRYFQLVRQVEFIIWYISSVLGFSSNCPSYSDRHSTLSWKDLNSNCSSNNHRYKTGTPASFERKRLPTVILERGKAHLGAPWELLTTPSLVDRCLTNMSGNSNH